MLNKDSELLIDDLIKKEKNNLLSIFSPPFDIPLIEIIRSLDTLYTLQYFLFIDIPDDLCRTYPNGYHIIIKHLLEKIKYTDGFPLYATKDQNLSWANSVLHYAGLIGFTEQLLSLLKAGLISLNLKEKQFHFNFIYNHPLEAVENASLLWNSSVLRDLLQNKIKKNEKNRFKVITEIRRQVNVWSFNPNFISYTSTPLIDKYFSKLSYFNTVIDQKFEHFDEDSKFDGITYKDYCDVTQEITSVCLKHKTFCQEGVQKYPQLKLYNILSFPTLKKDIIDSFSNYMGMEQDKFTQILECLILDKYNCEDHLKFPKSPLAPYVRISNTHLLRTIYGGIIKPYHFLRDELKRKYPTDYSKAVNDREQLFRKHIYDLFYFDKLSRIHFEERLIKLPKSIDIKLGKLLTDIDAVIFDKKKKTLGLFQLKWPDDFEDSMKARYNKITNSINKANEWVEKVHYWISQNTSESILKALGIYNKSTAITSVDEICIFVISRYNSHFTGVTLNEKAAWSSWYHLMEVKSKIASDFDDPIRELFFSLKMDSPYNPLDKEKYPQIKEFNYELGGYKFIFKNE